MVQVRVAAYAKRFAGARFVIIVRGVEEVAASWQARADNPFDHGWPEELDATRAASAWVRNMQRVVAGAANHPGVLVIDYDAFFADGAGPQFDRLWAHLELDPTPAITAAAERSRARYAERAARPPRVPPAWRRRIEAEVDPELWPAVQELARRPAGR